MLDWSDGKETIRVDDGRLCSSEERLGALTGRGRLVSLAYRVRCKAGIAELIDEWGY
jgi:hypothetical protein